MESKEFLIDYYKPIYSGLVALAEDVEKYALLLPEKLQHMEKIYLQSNNDYSDTEQKRIRYYREAFSYKFYLAELHTEQLWSLNYSLKTPPLLQNVLENLFDNHKCSDVQIILPCLCFEGFIIQSAAFLDFYMLFLCSIFKIEETKRLSGFKFKKALRCVNKKTNDERAKVVEDYFSDKIHSGNIDIKLFTKYWGDSLKVLRDSLVHRDSRHPDFCNDTSLLQDIGSWPEKEKNLPVARFCQDIGNDMIYMVNELVKTVYGLEYKPGPYKEGMFS